MHECAASAPPPTELTYSPWFLKLDVATGFVASTLNSTTHETAGFVVASVTVPLLSAAFDTRSELRVAVKLTAPPSRRTTASAPAE